MYKCCLFLILVVYYAFHFSLFSFSKFIRTKKKNMQKMKLRFPKNDHRVLASSTVFVHSSAHNASRTKSIWPRRCLCHPSRCCFRYADEINWILRKATCHRTRPMGVLIVVVVASISCLYCSNPIGRPVFTNGQIRETKVCSEYQLDVKLTFFAVRFTLEERSASKMTRTNNVSEHSPSRTSSSSSSAIAQPSSTEPKDIINQNELTIQKLLLELQDDLKKTKECYNVSREAWLSIQQPKSSTSSNENPTSQTSKGNLTQALGDVQTEIEMYRTALSKISQVRQLQIEIANVTKSQIDVNRTHTTRRGLADLLSHMAYVLKIWYGNEHSGNCSNKVSLSPLPKRISCLVTLLDDKEPSTCQASLVTLWFLRRATFHRLCVVLFQQRAIMFAMWVIWLLVSWRVMMETKTGFSPKSPMFIRIKASMTSSTSMLNRAKDVTITSANDTLFHFHNGEPVHWRVLKLCSLDAPSFSLCILRHLASTKVSWRAFQESARTRTASSSKILLTIVATPLNSMFHKCLLLPIRTSRNNTHTLFFLL